jgi:hypothetical protein
LELRRGNGAANYSLYIKCNDAMKNAPSFFGFALPNSPFFHGKKDKVETIRLLHRFFLLTLSVFFLLTAGK